MTTVLCLQVDGEFLEQAYQAEGSSVALSILSVVQGVVEVAGARWAIGTAEGTHYVYIRPSRDTSAEGGRALFALCLDMIRRAGWVPASTWQFKPGEIARSIKGGG